MRNGLPLLLLIAATTLLLTSSPAVAGKTSAIVNGRSYHIDSNYEWNEDNYGFGLEHEFSPRGAWKTVAMASGFRDSTNHMSYMAGAGIHRRIFETDRLSGFYIYAGLNAFLMSRDDVNDGKPFPGVLPNISVGTEKVGLNLTYVPGKAIDEMADANFLDPSLSGILFLQVKIRLDQLLP